MTHTADTKPTAHLRSLEQPATVAVIGASGGIGGAVVDALATDPGIARIWATSRREFDHPSERVRPLALDLTDEATIAQAADSIDSAGDPLDLVFVATGVLHDGPALQPEKTLRALDADALRRAFEINCIGSANARQGKCKAANGTCND